MFFFWQLEFWLLCLTNRGWEHEQMERVIKYLFPFLVSIFKYFSNLIVNCLNVNLIFSTSFFSLLSVYCLLLFCLLLSIFILPDPHITHTHLTPLINFFLTSELLPKYFFDTLFFLLGEVVLMRSKIDWNSETVVSRQSNLTQWDTYGLRKRQYLKSSEKISTCRAGGRCMWDHSIPLMNSWVEIWGVFSHVT